MANNFCAPIEFSPANGSPMQRLNKNLGGYFGDPIDIGQVLRDDLEAARTFGWLIEELRASEELFLPTFRRHVKAPRKKVYISTGVHGDEPAGPLAVRQLLRENQWPDDAGIWLCPCLNPTGFTLNRRENAHGIDLNRDYRHLQSAETRAHVAWLQRQPGFDLAICVHEDWEAHGYYLYELNPDNRPSLAEKIITEVEKICPIDHSAVIEGRPALNGIIRPDLDPNSRPQWPEAFYLIQNKTRLSYTLEAPSDFPLDIRIAAHVAALRAALG